MSTHKITTFAIAGSLFLTSLTPTYAVGLRDFLKGRLQVREEVKEKTASHPGFLRMFINGHVAIGSGELTVINGTTLTVTKDGKTYTVNTDDKTQFRRKFWGKSNENEFTVGDKVNIIGTWKDDTKTTILARLVRDISIQKRHGVFFGTVTTKTDTGFSMDTIRRGNQAVTVGSDTKYVNRREETINFSDIIVGQRVRVRGLWDSTHATITEVVKVKDFSLPPRSTPNGSPNPSAQ